MQRQPDITRAKTLLDWLPTMALEQGLVRRVGCVDKLMSAEDSAVSRV